mgnify:CR=1 FL=1
MKALNLLFIISVFFLPVTLVAQTYPTINPSMVVIGEEETEEPATSTSGSAPLQITFYANEENADGWTAHYEWRFYQESLTAEPYLVRYEKDTEFTFVQGGTHLIILYATFTRGSEMIEYTEEYWSYTSPLSVGVFESRLEMPNAFSPNHDERNDIYKAKTNYQSIVDFHGYIFNRRGEKLYDWTDIDGGWDGTYKGKDVPDGVYFCYVKARGADGRVFNIKKDVNLLRGYIEQTETTP